MFNLNLNLSNFFNINKALKYWCERRRRIKLQQLQSTCPHVRFVEEDGKFAVEATLHSPYGTTDYICDYCQVRYPLHIGEDFKSNTDYWAKHPNELVERLKQRDKIAVKLSKM